MIKSDFFNWERSMYIHKIRIKLIDNSSRLVCLLAFLILAGCASRPELPPEPELAEIRASKTLQTEDDEDLWGGMALTRDAATTAKSRMKSLSSFQQEYLVGPSDIIEIIYNFRYELTPEEYILEVQDDLNIELLFNNQLSRKVKVRMDGKITLPLVGEVKAADLSTAELQEKLARRYSRFIRNPEVLVTVEQGNIKIQELKKSITTAARGQSKIVPVRPDGKITLPLIGDVQSAGLTVPELRYEINRQYAQFVRNLDTTVILKEVRSPRIFVLGEVYNPGVFETTQPVTAMQALALAGGLRNTANDGSIVVLRDMGLPVPKGIKLDLDRVFDLEESSLSEEWEKRRLQLREKLKKEGREDITGEVFAELGNWQFIRNDLVLHRNDIVYVPKTFIAEVNKFIDQVFTQGIYSLAPADSTMGFILDTWDVIHLRDRY